MMNLQFVQNEVDLASNILDQSFQKLDQCLLVDAFLAEHEVQLPLIADGADHVDVHLLGLHFQDGRVAVWCIAARIVRNILHSGFITPEDLRIFLLRPGVDGRILLLQSALNRFRLLLNCLPGWPLHGKAPPLEIHPHSPYGHLNAILLLDQLPHRIPCPQAAFHLQLIRILVGDDPDNFLLPLRRQCPLLSSLPTPCLRLQRSHAAAFVVADRLTDRSLAEPGYFYDLLHRLLFLEH